MLGTVSRRVAGAGDLCVLVTGDRDAFQLAGERVSILYTRRGATDVIRVLFMMSELATYGTVSGLLFHQFHFSKQKFGSLSALVLSMIAGRVIYGIVISIATYLFGIPLGGIPAVIAATTTGIPGIIIQLIFVPAIVMAIVKGGYFDEVATATKKA